MTNRYYIKIHDPNSKMFSKSFYLSRINSLFKYKPKDDIFFEKRKYVHPIEFSKKDALHIICKLRREYHKSCDYHAISIGV